MRYSLIALCIGFILDLILGDPNYSWHPIRLIGIYITFIEKILRRAFPKTERGELAAGVFLVIIVAGTSTIIPLIILYVAYQWNTYMGILIESIFCYQLLATKSLKNESMKVYTALSADKSGSDNLAAGRKAVSMIVGRDTDSLTETGIIKATVETVAENTSDGIIAPMIYMVLGGAGFGFFYKAINTMDSMVGYKNDKYLFFGRCAAKLDDVLNYIPARISAYLMISYTIFTKYNTKNSWKIYHRDRYNHTSPNSAHTEAATAGALEIQLAGDAYYFGKLHQKKTIGDDLRPIVCEDIKQANQLLYGTAVLGMVLFSGIKIIILLFLY